MLRLVVTELPENMIALVKLYIELIKPESLTPNPIWAFFAEEVSSLLLYSSNTTSMVPPVEKKIQSRRSPILAKMIFSLR